LITTQNLLRTRTPERLEQICVAIADDVSIGIRRIGAVKYMPSRPLGKLKSVKISMIFFSSFLFLWEVLASTDYTGRKNATD
jgi:hypothetical protein